MTDEEIGRQKQETVTAEAVEAALQARLAEGEVEQAVKLGFEGLHRFGDREGFLRPLGAIFFKHGDMTRAEDYFRRLVAIADRDAEAWAGYGLVLGGCDRTGEAVDALRRALELDPSHEAAALNLGIALMKSQRADEARAVLLPLAAANPADMVSATWLGHAHVALDQLEEAVECYRRVEAANPGTVALPLALAERDLGNLEASGAILESYLAENPGHPVARFTLAQNHLMCGRFEEGFRLYESRWDRPEMKRPDMPTPLWQGEALEGRRILVHGEQGFGDCIQFVRYVKLLADRGATCGLMVRPRLKRLLSAAPGVTLAVNDPEEADFDFHVPMLSLPHLCGTTLDTVPADMPYLTPEPDLTAQWAPKLQKGNIRAGLIWQGDPASQSERGRSVPFENLLPLFDLPGVHWYILQAVHGREVLEGFDLPANVTDLGAQLDLGEDAFLDTAAVMRQLDVVVTSDTGPAHLAGALGCRTFVMLKKVPEWRYMLDRSDSPWYPGMQLFRQQEMGDWAAVIAQVGGALSTMVTPGSK